MWTITVLGGSSQQIANEDTGTNTNSARHVERLIGLARPIVKKALELSNMGGWVCWNKYRGIRYMHYTYYIYRVTCMTAVVALISIGNWSVSHPISGDPVLESTEPNIPYLETMQRTCLDNKSVRVGVRRAAGSNMICSMFGVCSIRIVPIRMTQRLYTNWKYHYTCIILPPLAFNIGPYQPWSFVNILVLV